MISCGLFRLEIPIVFSLRPHDLQLHVLNFFNFLLYSLSQNCWDTCVSPFPLTVGVQGLVTEPR